MAAGLPVSVICDDENIDLCLSIGETDPLLFDMAVTLIEMLPGLVSPSPRILALIRTCS